MDFPPWDFRKIGTSEGAVDVSAAEGVLKAVLNGQGFAISSR
jgi:hypothetical protein